jgi:hypothetical protein
MKKYHGFAEYYRHKTRQSLEQIKHYLEPEYHLGMEIAYNLYLQIFERIDVKAGNFTIQELHPSKEEIYDQLNATIASFWYRNTI